MSPGVIKNEEEFVVSHLSGSLAAEKISINFSKYVSKSLQWGRIKIGSKNIEQMLTACCEDLIEKLVL